MERRKRKKFGVGQTVLCIVLGIYAALCLLPMLLIVIVSFSSEASINAKGFSFFPQEWSLKAFEYIDLFVVDHEYGEWFTMLGNSGEVLSGYESKIDGWKCPYHNARMCFEIIERYEK